MFLFDDLLYSDPYFLKEADPQVMAFFPSTLNKSESDAVIAICEGLMAERGWGVWAVEALETQAFIGFVGLHIPRDDLPPSPCVEILWRLAPAYWGQGYATEAANAALQVGFEQLGLREIVAFTVPTNKRSRAVMERLGMTDTGKNFNHPKMPISSPLREHCLYQISHDRWAHGTAD